MRLPNLFPFLAPDDVGGAEPAPVPAPEPASSPSAAEPAPAPADTPAATPEGQAPEQAPAELPPNMQEAFTKRLGAEKAKLEREIRAQLEAEYQQKLTELAPPPPPPVPEENAEELARINEELLNEFYENPLKAMQKAREILEQREAARKQAEQAQWNYQAQMLARKYPDWQAVRPKMMELLQEQPDLAERPEHLERVYQLARKLTTPSPTDLLRDPNFRSAAAESLRQDPTFLAAVKEQLREEIIQEYITGKRAPATPPIMGNNAGGSPPAMPPATPKTWADAKRAAMARMMTNP